MVDASGEPNKVITPDGTTVLVGAVEYFELEKSGNQYTTIFEGNNDNGKYTVQLGESCTTAIWRSATAPTSSIVLLPCGATRAARSASTPTPPSTPIPLVCPTRL